MIRIAICDDEAYMSDIIGKMVSGFFHRKNMDIEKNFTKMMERLFLSLQDAGEANLLVQKGYESRIVSFDDIVFCEVIDRKVYLHLASSEVVDFFNSYVIGIVQILTGFYYFTRFLQKKAGAFAYLMFLLCAIAVITFLPGGSIIEFLGYALLLIASGIFICHADGKAVILYAALTIAIMQFSYGIVDSLTSILYPQISPVHPKVVGLAFMVLGNVALLLAVFCYHMVCRYFSYFETLKKPHVLLVLISILMIFFMGEYIGSIIYGSVVTDNRGIVVYTNHYQLLVIQVLGMASLFCIMFTYKKLLENARLNTELSLLEQEEHSLNLYVEEARTRYEKTKSFRHDVKNHITVIKELLQRGQPEQALSYMEDMEGMAEELAFPCSTNNPVADILLGNKLGLAKSMGIDVRCSLSLPHPCLVRDIDFGIILSNALDNAICACKHIEGGSEKYIRVMGRIQGDFIFLEVENSFQGDDKFREGTGLSNIKAVAEKYHGTMSAKTQGTAFVLSVLLIMPQQPGDIAQQPGKA